MKMPLHYRLFMEFHKQIFLHSTAFSVWLEDFDLIYSIKWEQKSTKLNWPECNCVDWFIMRCWSVQIDEIHALHDSILVDRNPTHHMVLIAASLSYGLINGNSFWTPVTFFASFLSIKQTSIMILNLQFTGSRWLIIHFLPHSDHAIQSGWLVNHSFSSDADKHNDICVMRCTQLILNQTQCTIRLNIRNQSARVEILDMCLHLHTLARRDKPTGKLEQPVDMPVTWAHFFKRSRSMIG